MIRNPVTWFEIPVTDLDRAVAFYRGVFGFELERVAIDGNEMALFPSADGEAGVSGALAKGDSYVPSVNGTRVYFSTEAIEDTLRKVDALGGRTLYPKTSIGALGWVAEFEDSEGNRVALHSNEQ